MAVLNNQFKKFKNLISELIGPQVSSLAAFLELGELGKPKAEEGKYYQRREGAGLLGESARFFYPFPKIEKYLSIIVTEKCNSRCAYCLRNTNEESKEMPFPILKRIILSAHRFGIKQFNLTGGEFFIYPHWRKLIELIGALKSWASIETNGISLKRESVIFLRDILEGKISEVSISLDSYKPSIHDKFRGQGTFDKAIQAIKFLRHYDIFVQTNALLTPLNFMEENDILNFIKLNKELGVNRVVFGEAVELGRAENSEFVLSKNQRKKIGQILARYNYFKEKIEPRIFCTPFEENPDSQFCNRLGREVCISPYGLHPCTFQAGVIKIGDFEDFEELLSTNFLSSIYWVGVAAQSCLKKYNFFSCAECVKNLPRWLSIIQKKLLSRTENLKYRV